MLGFVNATERYGRGGRDLKATITGVTWRLSDPKMLSTKALSNFKLLLLKLKSKMLRIFPISIVHLTEKRKTVERCRQPSIGIRTLMKYFAAQPVTCFDSCYSDETKAFVSLSCIVMSNVAGVFTLPVALYPSNPRPIARVTPRHCM